jgi:hypothetical protein
MRRTLILVTLAAALFAAPHASAATATAWKGVVVAKDAERGTVVTASADGTVRTARSAKVRTLKVGQRLDVRGVALSDGTFKASTVKVSGRAKTTRMKAVVVRNQTAQKRLLVSARGSTFALGRGKATRTLAAASQTGPKPGDQINALVNVTAGTAQATSVSTVGHLGVLEVEGILTKIAADSIELVVEKAGFVTLALPAGFALPAGVKAFDEVKAHVAVGTDGKLSLLALQGDDADDHDDHGVDFDDDDGELEVKGTISALSDTSVTVTPGAAASAVTCALQKPLTGFAVGQFVELKCRASGTAGALVLNRIEHEDDDENDDDDDDDDDDHDHSGPGKGDDDD